MEKGLPVDSKYFPSSGRMKNRLKNIAPLFGASYWFCNDLMKDAIERLEPGRHRFHPYILRNSSGKTEIAKLYIINILDHVDALDIENSEGLHICNYSDGSRRVACSPARLSKNKREIALFNHMVEGRHIWQGLGAVGTPHAYISDELYDIIKQHNPRPSPLRFYQTK